MLLLLISLAAIGAAVTALIWALVAPRYRAEARMQELGAYGYTGSLPTAAPQQRQTPRAVAEQLGRLVGRAVGTADDSRLRREIVSAGMYSLTPAALVGYQALAAGFGALLGLVSDPVARFDGPLLDTLFLAAMGWLIPITWVRRSARLRLARIDRDLPDAVDLVVVSVEAGQGFAQALATAAERTTGPLGEQLRLVLHEQGFGLPMAQALENFAKRADTQPVQSFVRSIVQGERLGVSIGQIMRNLAREMRITRRQNAEERAQKTTVKILFPLVFLIMPCMFIVLLAPPILGMGDLIGQ